MLSKINVLVNCFVILSSIFGVFYFGLFFYLPNNFYNSLIFYFSFSTFFGEVADKIELWVFLKVW
jgi:hypothetical protein